nr:cysteine desulfurase family protein [uncultured Holophaga sp.]
MSSIYLDHNASTPPLPEVVEAMVHCLREGLGNPSSVHRFGQEARRRLDLARAQVAAMISAAPEEIIFTSGGTEADNLALRGALPPGGRLAISAIEHSAIRETGHELRRMGASLTSLPVDHQGILRLDDLDRALAEGQDLVSIMAANNDLGTLQPIAEACGRTHAAGALFHTDAVQAAGKIPILVRESGVDLLSLSAHKLQGPKGVGALFVRRSLAIHPTLTGGSQERRLRPGTENLPGIVGFGVACEHARHQQEADAAKVLALRLRLEAGLVLLGLPIHGHPEQRLPNTVNVGLPGIPGEDMLLNLDLQGIAVSVGSACSSTNREPSYILQALGLDDTRARQAIRISLGPSNTEAEIDRTLEAIRSIILRFR